LTDQNAPPIIA